jgi:hypothetical protein
MIKALATFYDATENRAADASESNEAKNAVTGSSRWRKACGAPSGWRMGKRATRLREWRDLFQTPTAQASKPSFRES